MGSAGPGTLLTVVLAIVGPEKGTALAAFTVSPISVVGTAAHQVHQPGAARGIGSVAETQKSSSTIAANRSSGSAIVVPERCNRPNSRLPPVPVSPLDRIEAGHAATSVFVGQLSVAIQILAKRTSDVGKCYVVDGRVGYACLDPLEIGQFVKACVKHAVVWPRR